MNAAAPEGRPGGGSGTCIALEPVLPNPSMELSGFPISTIQAYPVWGRRSGGAKPRERLCEQMYGDERRRPRGTSCRWFKNLHTVNLEPVLLVPSLEVPGIPHLDIPGKSRSEASPRQSEAPRAHRPLAGRSLKVW